MRIRNKMLLAVSIPVALLIVQVAAVNFFVRELQTAVQFIGSAHASIEANFAAAESVGRLRQEIKKMPSAAVDDSLPAQKNQAIRETLVDELAAAIGRIEAAGAMQKVNPKSVGDIDTAFQDVRRQMRNDDLDERPKDLDTLLEEAIAIDRSLGVLNGLLAAAALDLRRGLQDAVDRERIIHDRPVIAGIAIGSMAVVFLLVFTWLYTDRHISRRLVALSRAMSAISGGDLRTSLPPGAAGDEIADMTKALSIFRDTAVEIESQNLRERQVVLDTIDYGVLLLDPALRVKMYNRAFVDLWRLRPSEVTSGAPMQRVLMAHRHRELHGIPDLAWATYVKARMDEIEDANQPPREWHRPDGRVLQYQIVSLPDGGRMLTYFDLTELKMTEDELRRAKEQAELASRAKSDFLASMSHELRTPLNAIIGITEILKEDAVDEGNTALDEPLGRVLRAGQHLLLLINEVLDLARIEAGKLELQPQVFELDGLLRELIETAAPLAQKNGNTMSLCCEGDVGRVVADPMRLKQVILNLLSNACKFTERGEIVLAVERDGNALRISVRDTGMGIEAEQLPRLFEEFHQVGAAKLRKYGGTGLGLAISRRLVDLMGGQIRAESELGKGSTFTVTLPLSEHEGVQAA